MNKYKKYHTFHKPASAASANPGSCLLAFFDEQRGSIPCCCLVGTCGKGAKNIL